MKSRSADSAHGDHDALDLHEPSTPGWLTLLGGALFLGGILALLVLGGTDTETVEDSGDDAAQHTLTRQGSAGR